ncbi:hypothetical protein H4R33_001818 [Dimargaris cristalligena]|nr:hypothetical protein H4R33_001818 [Dimargaris cristalligena]
MSQPVEAALDQVHQLAGRCEAYVGQVMARKLPTIGEPVSHQLEDKSTIVRDALTALSALHESVIQHGMALGDEANASMKEVLGIRDTKAVHTLLDFIVIQGMYPTFLPGVGVPLSLRLRSPVLPPGTGSTIEGPLNLEEEPPVEVRSRLGLLVHIVERLQPLVRDERPDHGWTTIPKMLLSRYLIDLYASALQLDYLTKTQPDLLRSAEAGLATTIDAAALVDYLVQHADVFRSLESLTALISGRPNHPAPPPWLRRDCSQHLTSIVTKPGGISILLSFMLDGMDAADLTAAKLENITRLTLAVPSHFTSPVAYYQSIVPQLLGLLDDIIGQSLKGSAPASASAAALSQTVTFILSRLIQKMPKYARVHIAAPILAPLLRYYPVSRIAVLGFPVPVEPDLPASLAPSKLASENEIARTIEALRLLLLNNDPASSLFERLLFPVVESVYSLYEFGQRSSITANPVILELLLSFFRLVDTATAQLALKRIVFTEGNAECAPGPHGSVELRRKSSPAETAPTDFNQFGLDSFIQAAVDLPTFVDFLQTLHNDTLVGDFFVTLLREYTLVDPALDARSGDDTQRLGTNLAVMHLISLLMDKLGPTILKRPGQILEFANGILERWIQEYETASATRSVIKMPPRASSNKLLEPMGQSSLNFVTQAATDPSPSADTDAAESNPLLAEIHRLAVEEPSSTTTTADSAGGIEELLLVLNLLAAVLVENKSLDSADAQLLGVTSHHLKALTNIPHPLIQGTLADLIVKVDARQARQTTAGPADQDSQRLSRDRYQQALEALEDDIVPIRAHGLSILRDMILTRDPWLNDSNHPGRLNQVFDLFVQLIKNEDSYLYLNAIKCLAALTDSQGPVFIPKLTSIYTNARGVSTLDHRLRAGEALLQTVQRCGEALPKYVNLLVPPLISVLLDRRRHTEVIDPETSETATRSNDLPGQGQATASSSDWYHLAASAIAILGVMAETSALSLQPWLEQLLIGARQLLLAPPTFTANGPELRRSTAVFLVSLLRGHATDWFRTLPSGALRDTYRCLKHVEATDPDLLTRHQARVGLGELQEVLRDYVDVPKPASIVMLN